MTDLPELGQ